MKLEKKPNGTIQVLQDSVDYAMLGHGAEGLGIFVGDLPAVLTVLEIWGSDLGHIICIYIYLYTHTYIHIYVTYVYIYISIYRV